MKGENFQDIINVNKEK